MKKWRVSYKNKWLCSGINWDGTSSIKREGRYDWFRKGEIKRKSGWSLDSNVNVIYYRVEDVSSYFEMDEVVERKRIEVVAEEEVSIFEMELRSLEKLGRSYRRKDGIIR